MPELKNDEKSAVIKKRAAAKKTAAKKTAAKKTAAKKTAAKKTAAKKSVTKKSTTKKAVTKKAVARRPAPQNLFSQRDRYEMIAKMAYFRAEKRGFESGWEQEDWLECEKLVDGMLKNT